MAIAIHTGIARRDADGYSGAAVDVAAHVLEAANGGQILVTAAAAESGAADDALVDLGIYQLGDLVDSVALFGVADQHVAEDARSPRARRLRVGNLPTASAPLAGRDTSVEHVIDAVAASRIVTLTGVGGIGKTCLALGVAQRIGPTMRDGAWFARLEVCTAKVDVVATLLTALGIEARAGGRRDLDTLVDGLRHRRALIVLDNCEHVLEEIVGAVAAVAALCPEVRVLATSREPLDVAGEVVVHVPPLDTSDDGPAVQLFIDRAIAAGATLDREADASVIGQICRRVEGIPLAIELAAARCRSLRPADIADRLDDMFTLLTSGRRSSPERHRTLRTALDWSYELLSMLERSVLSRASVFAGPFGIDAAEAVCRGGSLADNGVADVLDRLVVQSLLVVIDGGQRSRYRMLEPVRQFARERLNAGGETDGVRAAHTAWYVHTMASLGARWRSGEDQSTWPAAADDLPNMCVAFDSLIEAGRIDDAEAFVVDAFGPVDMHVDPIVECEWAPRALSLDVDHVGRSTASACAIAAWGVTDPEDHRAGASWIHRGVAAIGRGSVDDGLLTAAAMHQVLFGAGLPVSQAFLDRSIERATASDDLHRRVWVCSYTRRGEEALRAARQLGSVTLVALARLSLARSALATEDGDEVGAAIDALWDAAEGSHCPILLNHAAQMMGDARILAGAALDGLLLLRAPLQDWHLDGDPRVWDVLQSIATGLAHAGDAIGSAMLLGGIGGRSLPFAGANRQLLLALLDSTLGTAARQRHERDGRRLDLGALVADANARIQALARRPPTSAERIMRCRPSPSDSAKSPGTSPAASRTNRSPKSYSSAATPWRPTSATSSPASVRRAAPRSPRGPW